MKPRHTWIAVLPVAALLIAGCGGGGGDDESTESTAVTTAAPIALTKGELIEQGDAICAEVNAAVGASSTESGESAAQAADLYSGMVASLQNLGTPQESDGYAEFSSAADELATVEDEVKLASERGDTAALETAQSSASSTLASFQEAAGVYGFEDCSEGPSPVATPGGSPGVPEAGEEVESVEPEAAEPEVEAEPAPEVAPETGGAGGTVEGGGTGGGTEGGGGSTGGGSSGGIGPG